MPTNKAIPIMIEVVTPAILSTINRKTAIYGKVYLIKFKITAHYNELVAIFSSKSTMWNVNRNIARLPSLGQIGDTVKRLRYSGILPCYLQRSHRKKCNMLLENSRQHVHLKTPRVVVKPSFKIKLKSILNINEKSLKAIFGSCSQ